MMLGLSLAIGTFAQSTIVVDPAVVGTINSDSSTLGAALSTPTAGTTDSDGAAVTAKVTLATPNVLSWTPTRLAAGSPSAAADPLGGNLAGKLIEDSTAANSHACGIAVTNPSATVTLDVFIAQGTSGNRHWLQWRFGSTSTILLNVATGAVGAVTGGASAVLLGTFGGFQLWRVSGPYSAGTTVTAFLANDTPLTTYSGDGASFVTVFQGLNYL